MGHTNTQPKLQRRALIKAKFHETGSIAGTARALGCSRETVKRWVRREHGSLDDLPRSGRPRTYSAADISSIRRSARRDKTAVDISRSRSRRGVNPLSPATIRRILKAGRQPMRWSAVRRGNTLRDANKPKRVAFCRIHKSADVSEWVFVGAKTFYFYPSKHGFRQHAWQVVGSKGAQLRPTGTPWVFTFYAAVARGHKSRLYFVNPSPARGTKARKSKDNFKAQGFIGMMGDLLVEVKEWFPGSPVKMVLDNAKQHTAKSSKAFLEAQGVSTMDFPPQSYDLNMIEEVWALLVRQMVGRGAKSTAGWYRAMEEAWGSISQASIDAKVNKVKARMGKVINAGGNWCQE